MAGAGATVEDDEGPSGRGRGEVAVDLVPGLAGFARRGDVEGDFAFTCGRRGACHVCFLGVQNSSGMADAKILYRVHTARGRDQDTQVRAIG